MKSTLALGAAVLQATLLRDVVAAATFSLLRSHSQPSVNLGPADWVGSPSERELRTRPHFSAGKPEVIMFGIYAKSVSGIDLVKGSFNIDLVLTLQWNDPRVREIANQAGAKKVTMPIQAAKELMWLPDVVLSNRAQKGVDVISSALTVDIEGRVTKVERSLATLRSTFSTACFPFDSQDLYVRLASASLMADELVFEPLQGDNISGVLYGALNASNFVLDGWSLDVADETDSMLHKSRGTMTVRVSRHSWPHVQNLILPELLVLAISVSVFWLPPLAAFVMPRVATALISFLTLTTLGLRTHSMIPKRGGLSWIDLFENSCQSIVLFSLLMNILVLVVFHSFKETDIAFRMDQELSFFLPSIAMAIFIVVFWNRQGTHLALLVSYTSSLCLFAATTYFVLSLWRLRTSLQSKLEGQAGSTLRGLASAFTSVGHAKTSRSEEASEPAEQQSPDINP